MSYMADRHVGVAVVGTGHWGKNLVRNFADAGSLRAICDSDSDTLHRFAEGYPAAAAYRDYDELLADESIDAIVLATPAETHFRLAKQALRANKDLFVEKPLALRSKEGDELAALADQLGRVLMVGHLLHYHPAMKAIFSLVDSGELGDLLYMYSNRLNLGRVRREENVLWSFAPHDVSVMNLLAGFPVRVTASGGAYLQEAIYDTTVTSLLFAGGVRGHIYVSWLHPYKDHRLVLIGSRKMLVFDDLENAEKIRLYDKGVSPGDVTALRSNGNEVIPFESEEPLRAECEHFLECVVTRSTPDTGGAAGSDVLRVLEAAQLSLDNGGAPVSLVSGGGEKRFRAEPASW